MKKFLEEFKTFISRGNVMDMAIGVVVGGAFAAITGSLVSDVITPLLAVLFKSPNPDALNITLRAATEESEAVVLGLGTFIGTIVNFLVIALVIFSIIKAMNKAAEVAKNMKKKEEEEAAAAAAEEPPKPTTEEPPKPTTEELLTSILEELQKK
ncbi:MAG: large conductance mechanosensitive channel protein MscL [Oscillospiraceae bacterium]|nr:large conductance mechanosensitive channel protein MscL [Oscillospiraceae bacterium]